MLLRQLWSMRHTRADCRRKTITAVEAIDQSVIAASSSAASASSKATVGAVSRARCVIMVSSSPSSLDSRGPEIKETPDNITNILLDSGSDEHVCQLQFAKDSLAMGRR